MTTKMFSEKAKAPWEDEAFDLTKLKDESFENECLTVWIPKECKQKYDLLQELSKRKFSKFLRDVVKKTIDKVEVEAS